MKTVAKTLGVARSNLVKRQKGSAKPRGRYRKAEDVELLPLIRTIVDERPSYDYRRVWALLNRQLRAAGKPTVNMKWVLRVMQNHGLTLERHTARRPDRGIDGGRRLERYLVIIDALDETIRDGRSALTEVVAESCHNRLISALWPTFESWIKDARIAELDPFCLYELLSQITRSPSCRFGRHERFAGDSPSGRGRQYFCHAICRDFDAREAPRSIRRAQMLT